MPIRLLILFFAAPTGEVNWARSLNNTNTHSASSQSSSNGHSSKEEMLTSSDLIEQFNTQVNWENWETDCWCAPLFTVCTKLC